MSHIEEITDQFDETHLSSASSSFHSTSHSSSSSLGSFYDSGSLDTDQHSYTSKSSSYTGPKIEEITDEDDSTNSNTSSHITSTEPSASQDDSNSDHAEQSTSNNTTNSSTPSISEILNEAAPAAPSSCVSLVKNKEKALEAKTKGNQFFSRQQ